MNHSVQYALSTVLISELAVDLAAAILVKIAHHILELIDEVEEVI